MQWILFDAHIARLVEAVHRDYVHELTEAGFAQPVEGWEEHNAPDGRREWKVTAGFVQYLAERDVPFSVL